jgi:uncharacterized NAD(P)/FAD-binding protein YdhS
MRIVIVGGGAAGAFTATQLVRGGGAGLELVLVEPRAELGLGVAYSTRDPWHRLNVPAIAMSAHPDDPQHLSRWAGLPGEAFARRVDYGRYLQAVLADAVAGSPATVRHVRATAERIRRFDGGRLAVDLDGGEVEDADAVVLSTGLETPVRLGYLAPIAGDPRLVEDPWPPGALDGIGDGQTVAILGSSLTAIDVAGSILTTRPAARVVALSRNGELPRPHEDPWRPRLPEPAFSLDEFFAWDSPLARAAERFRSFGEDWPRAIDSIRPISQALWMRMDDRLRREFLDHYRHDWEIHRHRVAGEIARDLERWIEAGRLSVHGAAIERIDAAGRQLRIEGTDGRGEPAAWQADHLVVAIGPNPDATANPLLGAVIAEGLARPGSMGIAIDVDPTTGLVIAADGRSELPLYAMGALRKGALWETLAVPEIRDQAVQLAARLLSPASA